MRWQRARRSQNIEDRRGSGQRVSGKGLGVVGTVLVLVGAFYFGIDPQLALNVAGNAVNLQDAPQQAEPYQASAREQQLASLVAVVLADTEHVWHRQFKQMGADYREPTLVMFSGATKTACGQGQSAMGPFYCGADQKVYIDLEFYQTLRRQLKAPGDFAQAYVIAHEVGHHVQNLLGISDKVQRKRQQLNKRQSNALSVLLELQADCLAGIWAHHADKSRQLLEQGDLDEAINAASRIGDDTLQKQAGGRVRPESFTHGSAAQRQHWFKQGFDSGKFGGCDTFTGSV
jgi:predicted metalloprotease